MAKKNLKVAKPTTGNATNGKVQKKDLQGAVAKILKKADVPQKQTPKKAAAKKANKKEIEKYASSSDEDENVQQSEEDEEQQVSGDESDNENDNGVEDASDNDDSEQEQEAANDSDEEEDGDDDDDDEDDDDDNDDDDDDDGEPEEKPISKVEKVKDSSKNPKKKNSGSELPTIKTVIPKTYDSDAIVKLSNIKPNCKSIDIVEAFMGFGKVCYIQKVAPQVQLVAFENAEQAKAAIDANGTVVIDGNKVQIKPKAAPAVRKNPEEDESLKRCVVIRNLPKAIAEQGIKDHFKSCGEIEHIKLYNTNGKKPVFAVARFSDASAVDKALKLHNSQINDEYILVSKHRIFSSNEDKSQEDKRTVIVMNTKELKTVSAEELKKVFKKCGEIERVDIYCKKVLAFIVFAKTESVAKALQLNGKTVDGLQIQVEECKKNQRSPTVFLQNLNKMSTDEAIKEHFSTCGGVKKLVRHPQSSTAILEFENLDGYCKAFLLDSDMLDFNRIFVEPFSTFKQRILAKKNSSKPAINGGKRKTPYPQGPKGFNYAKNAKKPKMNNSQ